MLKGLLECHKNTKDHHALALAIGGDKNVVKRLGWVALPEKNPFLKEYRTPKVVRVFGHTTRHIAFTAHGLLAVLDQANARQLAKRLRLAAAVDTNDKVLFSRLISKESKEDKAIGMVVTKTISLNVSTVSSHPGKTLVGCSYRIDFD
jgi:hypothetical protein